MRAYGLEMSNKEFIAPAVVLDVFATALVIAGLFAFLNAPPQASAKTALIIPGIAATAVWIIGFITLAGVRRPKLGRLGFRAGAIVTCAFALLFLVPAYQAHRKLQNYPAAKAEWTQAVAQGTVADDLATRKAFFTQRGSPWHDNTYLVNTLWTLSACSVLGFSALMGVRPVEVRRGAVQLRRGL